MAHSPLYQARPPKRARRRSARERLVLLLLAIAALALMGGLLGRGFAAAPAPSQTPAAIYDSQGIRRSLITAFEGQATPAAACSPEEVAAKTRPC